MASDLFLPCLLSRLTDEAPQQPEDQAPPLLDPQALRQEIAANIDLILNARSHVRSADLPTDLRFSVLDFGIGDFCGCPHTEQQLERIQNELEQALRHFEPRIDPNSITVRALSPEESADDKLQAQHSAGDGAHGADGIKVHGSVFKLAISCTIKVAPLTDQLFFISSLDLENGNIQMRFTQASDS